MTIYRHPVPAHPGLPPCLPCIDLADGRFVPGECKRLRDACESKTFNCPNLDGSKSRRDKCWKSAFLYPRGARSWGFHFHQGVDLAGGRHGATIVSVTNGVVRMAASTYEAGVGGYGRTVVIESDLVLEGETTTLWFLYAHCKEILVSKGQVVVEQQPIATVGISDTYKPEHGKAVIFDGTDPSKSHLHFEVSRTAYPKGRGVESQIDDLPTLEDKPREDPLAILEMLGPWGPKQLSFPDGEKVDAETLLALHAEVEGGAGGYFPLGSNNLWHGGVHLPMAEGSKVVAPFDGVIVAARLDPDPDSNEGAFGDTNFILLRHVISEAVFNRIQGKPEDPSPSGGKGSGKKKTESVGRKGTNPPDLVTKVEKRLSELVDEATGAPFFDPAAGDLVAAIEAYQRSIGFRNPDGNITVGQRTWNALFPAVEPDGPDAPGPTSPVSDAERERVIYCLLMHLQARPLDGDLVEDVPWLRDVKLSPEPGDPEPPEEDDPKTIAEDEAEASRGIKGPVGAPDASGTPVAGDSGDVAWVQKRLRRLSDWTGASDGKLFNEALQAAIAKFQREHVTWYRKHPKEKPPGYVLPGKDTERALATPRHELLGKKSTKPQLDPVLKHRLSQRNADGTARIVTNLGARVGAGDTLWWSGRAAGFDGDSGTKDSAQVHWEIFSEEPLVMGWSELEDDDEDLRVDLPLWIYGVVETHVMPAEFEQDKIFTPAEIANFYADDRSNFLRMTRCQFRSEWGVDIDKLVGDLTGREWNTTGLAAQLRPYVWWDEVAGAVDGFPSSPHVWHYNPIELIGLYQAHLDALQPPSVVVRDPDLYATLVARVYYDNRVPMADAVVLVTAAGVPQDSRPTDATGTAVFPELPIGPYEAFVMDSKHPMVPAPVLARQVNEIEFVTEHPGPELEKGHIRVVVRKHTKVVAKGVKVALLRADATPAASGTTNGSGQVVLGGLEPQKYQLAYGDADLMPLEIVSGRNKTKTVYLPPPLGQLDVFVQRAGVAVEGATVAAANREGGFPTGGQTGPDGHLILELREGKYDVSSGNSDPVSVTVSAKKQKSVVATQKPDPARGGG